MTMVLYQNNLSKIFSGSLFSSILFKTYSYLRKYKGKMEKKLSERISVF